MVQSGIEVAHDRGALARGAENLHPADNQHRDRDDAEIVGSRRRARITVLVRLVSLVVARIAIVQNDRAPCSPGG